MQKTFEILGAEYVVSFDAKITFAGCAATLRRGGFGPKPCHRSKSSPCLSVATSPRSTLLRGLRRHAAWAARCCPCSGG